MRRGLTLAWMLALAASFHWWDVTLRFPRLLVWTWAFLALFLATAIVLFGRGLRARRREVWLPAAVWVALALGADLATVVFPAVSVEGRRVAAAVWLPVLDLVLPIWMTARAFALVWARASLWPVAAGSGHARRPGDARPGARGDDRRASLRPATGVGARGRLPAGRAGAARLRGLGAAFHRGRADLPQSGGRDPGREPRGGDRGGGRSLRYGGRVTGSRRQRQRQRRGGGAGGAAPPPPPPHAPPVGAVRH